MSTIFDCRPVIQYYKNDKTGDEHNYYMNNKSTEFQLMKGMAIIGLPIVHVSEYVDEQLQFVTRPHQLLIFLTVLLSACGPALFTICMGYGIGGSKKSSLKYFSQGIQFLLLGAILNILRFILPALLKYITSTINIVELHNELYKFFKSDIYYFIGLFFVVYATLKYFHLSTNEMIILGIVALIISNAVSPYIAIDNQLLNNLAGNFIYLNKNSCFPLAVWFVFPCIGIALGESLKALNDEEYDKTIKRMGFISFIIIVGFTLVLKSNIFQLIVGAFNQYFINVLSVILLTCITFICICFAHIIRKRWLNTKAVKLILMTSTYIIVFYTMQWILVSWSFMVLNIFDIKIDNVFLHMLLTIMIMIISILICKKWGYKLTGLLIKLTYVQFKKRKY